MPPTSSSSSPPPTTANITPAPLTITASSQIQSYGFGGTSAALGTTAFTVIRELLTVGSDSVTSVKLSTNATLSGSSNYDAGTWSITPSGAIGSGLGNYTSYRCHWHAANQSRGSDRHGQ